jgi:hypothetical protein
MTRVESRPAKRAWEIAPAASPEMDEVLSPEALEFVGKLVREFGPRREQLLKMRADRQREIEEGAMPDFLPGTRKIRESAWTVGAIPKDLMDRQFAEAIRARYPEKFLAYNCSPSFNWRRALDERQIGRFQNELAAMGYKFQFITLAGFHTNNLSMFELAHAYRDQGMLAYSQLQQREFELERDHGYRAVKHQSFVGAGYFDDVTQVVTGGLSSIKAMDGSTELAQFTEKTPLFREAEIHHMGYGGLEPLPPATPLVEPPETHKAKEEAGAQAS